MCKHDDSQLHGNARSVSTAASLQEQRKFKQELSDYARTHSQRNGLKVVHSMKESELPELVTALNRLARGTHVASRLDIRDSSLSLIL